MSRRDPAIALKHMRDAAAEAAEISGPMTREDLDSNRVANLALVRLLEIVGEAATRVDDEAQSLHPEIPWRSIIGLRSPIK